MLRKACLKNFDLSKSLRDVPDHLTSNYFAKLTSFQFQFIRLEPLLVVLFCLHLHSVFVFVFYKYAEKKVIARKNKKIVILFILFKICSFIPFIVTSISGC